MVRFASACEHFELAGGSGVVWTRAEDEAGANRKRLLTLEDPAPQTVYLFPDKARQIVLAQVVLNVKS